MATPKRLIEFNLLGERFLGQMFILAALLAALYGVGRIMAPYVHAFVLAALVAYLFHPLHQRLRRRVRSANLAALLSCTVVALLIIIPVVFLASVLANKGMAFWEQAKTYVQEGRLEEDLRIERLEGVRERPAVKRVIALWETHLPPVTIDRDAIGQFIINRANEWLKKLGPAVAPLVGNLMAGVLNFLLMFVMMFYFFRDGDQVLGYLLALVPLPPAHTERLIERVKAVSRSAVFGTLATAIVQGMLSMAGFAIAGIPWLFWGVVAGFASLVPVVGTALVWVPAAGFLLIDGRYWQAIFLILWGSVVVGTSDNFLRPYFMKGDTGMSGVIAFFAILGGLQLFGLLGIIYGPLIVGVGAMLIYIFRLEKEAGREVLPVAAGDYYQSHKDTDVRN